MAYWIPGLIQLGITFATSQVGFVFGNHLAALVEHLWDKLIDRTKQNPTELVALPSTSQENLETSNEHELSAENSKIRMNLFSNDLFQNNDYTVGNSWVDVVDKNRANNDTRSPAKRVADNIEVNSSNNSINRMPCTVSAETGAKQFNVVDLKENDHRPLAMFKRDILFPILTASVLTIIVWVLAFTDPARQRSIWWIAVAFGPFGAILRFWLSLFNPKYPNFPLFTFLANVSACVANICFYIGADHLFNDLGEPLVPQYDHYEFWVLAGMSTGMMGSLSTVSTWINELNKLAKKRLYLSYRYGGATIVAAYALCWVIVGTWMGLGYKF